ncbi:MAG: DcrB-related protein [Anaerolineae bacterium]|nr:DcrB-related protein [Phycisphaerae bacterium]
MTALSRIILLSMSIWLIGCSSSSGTKSIEKLGDGNVVTTYDDPKYGLRLTYPGDWEEQSIPFMLRPKGTIIVLKAQSKVDGTRMPPTMSVVANDKASGASLEQMQQQMIDKAKGQFSDFKLIESGDAKLGTEPAKRITYTGSKLGVSLQVMNVIATHGGKGFAVAYSADPEIFAQELPDVQKVIESIRWVQR